MKFTLLAVASLLAIAQSTFASDNVTAKVIYTGMYGNGDLFIALDTQINEAGCPKSRIDIISTNPQIKNWLAIAEAALASGRSVIVRTGGCYAGNPTMDSNRDMLNGGPYSFILMNNS